MSFSYLTLSFFPALMLVPLILLSFLSFATVVWLRAAISLRVSPCLMVMLLPLVLLYLLRLFDELFLLPDEAGSMVFTATSLRLLVTFSGTYA